MIARARGRYVPLAPRKARRIARVLKGIPVLRAQAVLKNLPKAACRPVAKILDSAVANATREGTWTAEQLVVSKIVADGGPVMKRYRAAAMGRAAPIGKRMCHVTIELDRKENPRHGS